MILFLAKFALIYLNNLAEATNSFLLFTTHS
jgi:hypothetical protein